MTNWAWDTNMSDFRTRKRYQFCSVCPSRSCCIFSDLDNSHLMKLEQMCLKTIYPDRVVVHTEGDQPQGIYIVCFGRVKLSLSSPNGQAVIIGLATAGDAFGVESVLSGRPHSLMAETVEQTQLCFIKKDDFFDFLRYNGDVSLILAQRLSNNLYEAHLGLSDLAFKQSFDRLVELLLRQCKSGGDPTPKVMTSRIDLSQDELADMIGVSRRTITRGLTKLRQLKIIKCRRRSVIIKDLNSLEKILESKTYL